MKKVITTILTTIMMLINMMSTTAFAAVPEAEYVIQHSTNYSDIINGVFNYTVYFDITPTDVDKRGDVNGDGMVNASDASMVLEQYSSSATGADVSLWDTIERDYSVEPIKNFYTIEGGVEVTEIYVYNSYDPGDVNFDGIVNAVDASLILQYYSDQATGSEIYWWSDLIVD